MVWVLIVVLVVIVLLVVWLIALYNGLVQKRNRVDNAWAQIEVQLKRRRDLIPNLDRDGQGLRGARARHVRGGDAGAGRRGGCPDSRRRPPPPRASSARRSAGCSPSPRPTRT